MDGQLKHDHSKISQKPERVPKPVRSERFTLILLETVIHQEFRLLLETGRVGAWRLVF